MDLGSLTIKVARNENLPILPELITEILALTENDNSSFNALERLINRDPAICAKVLRVANSAYYGGHSVSSLSRAISLLGMSTVQSLSISLAFHQFVGNKSECAAFDKWALWRHSLGVAVSARIIGWMKMQAKADDLYGWGLMHDVGLLVLERYVPDLLDAAFMRAKSSGSMLEFAERQTLGYDHTKVGSILADKWNLPDAMRSAIEFHLNPNEDKKHFETTAVIHVADAIARRRGLSPLGRAEEVDIDGLALAALDLPEEQLPAIEELVIAEVDKIESSFMMKPAA